MSLLTGTSTSRISQMVVRPWDADLVVSFFFLQPCKIAESLSEQWNQQTRGGETTSVEKGISLLHGFNINGMMAPMGAIGNRAEVSYCYWMKSRDHQLRLVVYHIIYKVLYIPCGFLAGFPKHQQVQLVQSFYMGGSEVECRLTGDPLGLCLGDGKYHPLSHGHVCGFDTVIFLKISAMCWSLSPHCTCFFFSSSFFGHS